MKGSTLHVQGWYTLPQRRTTTNSAKDKEGTYMAFISMKDSAFCLRSMVRGLTHTAPLDRTKIEEDVQQCQEPKT